MALGFTASKNLLDHRTCLSRSTGKRLAQVRRRSGMATAGKKQSAQIFRSLRGSRVKLESDAKPAFRILKVSQGDLHCCPVVPKPCRRGLCDCIGEKLGGRYKILLLIERFRSLEDVVDYLRCRHRALHSLPCWNPPAAGGIPGVEEQEEFHRGRSCIRSC